jgi:hypothetical protein
MKREGLVDTDDSFDPRDECTLSESEWLASTSARDLSGHLIMIGGLRSREGDRAGERKLRLFGVACCKHIHHWSKLPLISDTINATEKFADDDISADELHDLQQAVEVVGYPPREGSLPSAAFDSLPLRLARAASLIARFDDSWPYVNDLWEVLHQIGVYNPETTEELANANATATLLRDIFGNPFRPVLLDRSWLTSDVVTLARGIYDERAFDRMPILADALQDAGCTSDEILNHCRDTNAMHVRGCWVVDLLLCK